jgi:hypothetical protein
MSSPKLTGQQDADIHILSKLDPLSLINLYRTNLYIKELLSKSSTISYLARKNSLVLKSYTFQSFINELKTKLIDEALLTNKGFTKFIKIITLHDNSNILSEFLQRWIIQNDENEDEKILNDYEQYEKDIIYIGKKCVDNKSNKCLEVLGDFIDHFMTILDDNIGRTNNDSDIIQKIFIYAVSNKNYSAVEIILSWELKLSYAIEDYDALISYGLSEAVEHNDNEMFDFLIDKTEHKRHHDLKLLIQAIKNKNDDLIVKIIETYDFDYINDADYDQLVITFENNFSTINNNYTRALIEDFLDLLETHFY